MVSIGKESARIMEKGRPEIAENQERERTKLEDSPRMYAQHPTRHQHVLLQLGESDKELVIVAFVEVLYEIAEERKVRNDLVYFRG